MIPKKYTETDVLIVGGGIAGIRAAVEASEQGAAVVLINKGHVGQDGAAVWMAGGGMQAALYPPDSLEQHFRDTIVGGKFLNQQDQVVKFLSLAPESVDLLDKWRVRWGKEKGRYKQALLPGETHPRCLMHTKPGEHVGTEFRKALPRQLRLKKNIQVIQDTFVIDLLKKEGQVVGAAGLDIKDGSFHIVAAKCTILATGGFMACYEFTTANPNLTGDGHGMAYRAGAKMCDMEFIQFFPAAALWPPNVRRAHYPYSLFFELYGILFNSRGERFMERYYPVEKDFIQREAQSRAIAREVREGRGSPHGGAYLSFRHMPRNLLNHFLEVRWEVPFFKDLRKVGVDIREDALEIGPAAHYIQGGCWINDRCETSLPGLYAAGECAGGKDGADRLAGNALSFCMGMGYVAGREAATQARSKGSPSLDEDQVEAVCSEAQGPFERSKGIRGPELKREIRRLMSTYNMYHRKEEEMQSSLDELAGMRREMLPALRASAQTRRFNLDWIHAMEARNMLDVAEMSFGCAIRRKESRGLHERADYPDQDPAWLRHNVIANVDGEMHFATEPVDFSFMKPPEISKA